MPESTSKKRKIFDKPAGESGPEITFQNDDPNGVTPNQKVTDKTASMLESAVKNAGVSININSTTNGSHATTSRHYWGQAIDINRVNGNPVNSGNEDAKRLQDALQRQNNIRENFGPFCCEKTVDGEKLERPDQKSGHQNHIHISGQE